MRGKSAITKSKFQGGYHGGLGFIRSTYSSSLVVVNAVVVVVVVVVVGVGVAFLLSKNCGFRRFKEHGTNR